MRKMMLEILGILMVLASVVFFYFSVQFLSERDYIAAILQIFVGFAMVRSGLELTRMALLDKRDT
jgi:putative Mn2+ efflux pump MntP